MGEHLVRRLSLHGVKGVVTTEHNPDRAAAKYLLGTLELIPPEPHGYHHDHHGTAA